MRVRLVRRPGQPGTKDLQKQYGERLICVRYRYDAALGRRYKTAEIIVEEAQWTPATRSAAGGQGADTANPHVNTVAAASEEEPSLPQRSRIETGTLVAPAPPLVGQHNDRATPGASSLSSRGRDWSTLDSATLVGVRLPQPSKQLESRLSRSGAAFRELLKAWILPYGHACQLQVDQYIVDTLEDLVAAWNASTTSRVL